MEAVKIVEFVRYCFSEEILEKESELCNGIKRPVLAQLNVDSQPKRSRDIFRFFFGTANESVENPTNKIAELSCNIWRLFVSIIG